MADSVTFLYAALGTISYQVPEDCVATGFTSGVAVLSGISWNPSVLATDYTAPPATKVDNSTMVVIRGAGFVPLFQKLSAGDLIFAYASGAGATQLFFDVLS